MGESDLNKQWAEYSQEERESMTDTFLGELRKLMIEPDTVINMSMSKPTARNGSGVRFTGAYLISVSASGRLKPFCHRCGNAGRLPKMGEPEQKNWPLCDCAVGQRIKELRDEQE